MLVKPRSNWSNRQFGWKAGDRLIVPDTRQVPFRKKQRYISQAEEPTVQAIAGSTVTLHSPLEFDHWGPRDANGEVGAIERSMLPHVGNLTRNVIIRSTRLTEASKTAYCLGAENVNAPSSCVTRGHTLFLRRATVDIRYARFEHLGRTTNDSLNNTSVDGNGTLTSIGLNQIGTIFPPHASGDGPREPDEYRLSISAHWKCHRGYAQVGYCYP